MAFFRKARISLAGAVGCGLLCQPVAASADAPCFSAADNARLGFTVLQLAPPPARGERDYAYYPLTGVATMRLGMLPGAPAGLARYYFQWANRSNAPLRNAAGQILPRKANIQPTAGPGRAQRTPFSSVGRADACTLAQAASELGMASRADRLAHEAGITLVRETDLPDSAALGPQDHCVLADARLPQGADGLMLDYEVQDGRSGEQTFGFLQAFAQLVRESGHKALLLLDPFDAPSQRYSGISASNARQIVDLFDLTTLMLWGGNRQHDFRASYAAQMALLGQGGAVPTRKLLIDFDLAQSSLDDARFVRQAIIRDGLAGVVFWRNRSQQGGSCGTEVNRKIAAVAFATPSGSERH